MTKPEILGIGMALASAAERSFPDGWRSWVGIGDVQPGLAEASVSFTQGKRAAKIVSVLQSFGQAACWSDLGVYRMLSTLTVEQLTADLLHPGLTKLLEHTDSHVLIPTLERFFDKAGDVQATSRQLYLHRGTLYNRLRKVERITGLNLGRGDDRLSLHLSLKLARLAGLLPGQAEPRVRNMLEAL